MPPDKITSSNIQGDVIYMAKGSGKSSSGKSSSGKSASGKTSVTTLPNIVIKPNSALNKLASSDLSCDQFRCVICGHEIRFSPNDPETSEAEINASTHKECFIRSIANSMPQMMHQPQQTQPQQEPQQQASAQQAIVPQQPNTPVAHTPIQMPWSQDIQQVSKASKTKPGGKPAA